MRNFKSYQRHYRYHYIRKTLNSKFCIIEVNFAFEDRFRKMKQDELKFQQNLGLSSIFSFKFGDLVKLL